MDEVEPNEANLRIRLQVLSRRFLWIATVTILSVGVAVGISLKQTKEYSATAQLLVQPPGFVASPISGTQQTISPTDILTELQLVTSAPVKARATREFGFAPAISASQVGATNVISVTATAKTPSLATRIANMYSKIFVADQRANAIDAFISAEKQYQTEIDTLDAQIDALGRSSTPAAAATISALASQVAQLKGDLAQLQVAAAEAPGGVEVVSPASQPSSPSSPRPLRDGVIALVIGLLLGIGLALLVDYFDDKVYTKEDVERLTGVPVLSLVAKIRGWKKIQVKLIALEDMFSPVTESYRTLGTSLHFARDSEPLKTILVTSAGSGEGKTSTVANLGLVLANSGERVVMVDCDLRRPRLGELLHISETPGYTSVLLGQIDLTSAVYPLPNVPGLNFLGTGPIPPNFSKLLGSAEAAEIFKTLSCIFDVVLVDSPPLPVTDSLVLSSYVDAVVLVVAAGETRKGQVERAIELLGQVNTRPTGILLNKVTRPSKHSLNYDYSYKHSYPPQPSVEPQVDQSGQMKSPAPRHRRAALS